MSVEKGVYLLWYERAGVFPIYFIASCDDVFIHTPPVVIKADLSLTPFVEVRVTLEVVTNGTTYIVLDGGQVR